MTLWRLLTIAPTPTERLLASGWTGADVTAVAADWAGLRDTVLRQIPDLCRNPAFSGATPDEVRAWLRLLCTSTPTEFMAPSEMSEWWQRNHPVFSRRDGFQPEIVTTYLKVAGGDHALALRLASVRLTEAEATEVCLLLPAAGGDLDLAGLAWEVGLTVAEAEEQARQGTLNRETLEVLAALASE